MMTTDYIAGVVMSKKDFERVGKLLEIEELSEIEEDNKLEAKPNDRFNLFTATFDNGHYMIVDMASGHSNYFEDMSLFDADGYWITDIEPTCTLDTDIVIFVDDTRYIVEIALV